MHGRRVRARSLRDPDEREHHELGDDERDNQTIGIHDAPFEQAPCLRVERQRAQILRLSEPTNANP